jgi:PAS domain S-box-containing protein
VVEARRVRLTRGDHTLAVRMSVRPVQQVRHAQAAKGWLIVRFEEAPLAEGDDVLSAAEIAVQAEHDLFSLHQQLSTAIGESDSSSEALRASNEELQSVNEELRSTTEELETSKEELQSVNEELTTVNYDLKLHLDASAKAHDDLHNFLVASEIVTVFVDRGLCIQRFTPQASGIFNLLPTDVSRPLFDLTHRLDYPQMEADAREAFESLRPIEREVESCDGRWFMARVLPYRSGEDRIEGVVLNFIDVTARHQAEQTVRSGEERLRLLFDSSTDYIIILLDPEGRITRWNKGAELTLGFTEAEALGRPTDIIFTAEDRAAGAPQDERRRALQDGRAKDERWHLRKDGGRVYFSGVLVPLASGAEKGYAKIARDLTQARLAEQQRDELLASEQSLRAQLEEANAMKDEFLAVMSHELKNPLNLIALNAQMLAFHPARLHEPDTTRRSPSRLPRPRDDGNVGEFEMKIVRDVVVIGAALGGLSVLGKIGSSWPRDLPVSVLIALAAPDQPPDSVLQIIQWHAPVQVTYARHGEPIERRHIYVAPPGKHLAIGRFGMIRTEEPSFFDTVTPSVNRLFSAAALVYGPRVIGIVLSGNQYDGVQGMRDIEAAGGVTIVQDPDDAIAPQMPRHVILNDHPRYCVEACEMEPLIRRLVVGEA